MLTAEERFMCTLGALLLALRVNLGLTETVLLFLNCTKEPKSRKPL